MHAALCNNNFKIPHKKGELILCWATVFNGRPEVYSTHTLNKFKSTHSPAKGMVFLLSSGLSTCLKIHNIYQIKLCQVIYKEVINIPKLSIKNVPSFYISPDMSQKSKNITPISSDHGEGNSFLSGIFFWP